MVINEEQGVLVRAFLDEREEDRCDSEERKSAVRYNRSTYPTSCLICIVRTYRPIKEAKAAPRKKWRRRRLHVA
jgi:hypothetical protein